MDKRSIDPQTCLGPVYLAVSDLQRSVAFYEQRLGFQARRSESGKAYLGAGSLDLLVLVELPGARLAGNCTGLYHVGFKLPSRLELACSLAHLAKSHTPLDGLADHAVCETIYLGDPDELGLALYRDRPREQWPFRGDELQLFTMPFKLDEVLQTVATNGRPWAGMAAETTIGHVHLRVANLDQAEYFYTAVLGFTHVARLQGKASFVAAGDYHHHIALNIWGGEDLLPPPLDAARLLWYTIRLPSQSALDAVVARLHVYEVPYQLTEQGYLLADPSHNGILLTL